MNYQKIYAAFITDRRSCESHPLIQYVEKHHIVPSSLGGGDEPENLIYLTPEDHFFAHLLLAKIHGGAMWAPIAFMVGGDRKDYTPTQSRKRHGWAARAMGAARCGEGSPQFDHTVYQVVNASGEMRELRQSDMPAALGVSKSLANMLIKGSVSVARGWSIAGKPRKTQAGSKHHMHKPEVREFRHVRGEVFIGTQLAFSEEKCLGRPAVSGLVKGTRDVTKGWYLAERGFPVLKMGSRWAKLLNQ